MDVIADADFRARNRTDRRPRRTFLIHAQTQRNARGLGMTDRGALLPGMKADINLIDYARLNLEAPQMTYGLPAGGRRLVRHATGHEATFVSGERVMERGKATGARPERLVRSA